MPIMPGYITDWQIMSGDFINVEFRLIIMEMDVVFRGQMAKTKDYFAARNNKGD